jgi:hypothetical protein
MLTKIRKTLGYRKLLYGGDSSHKVYLVETDPHLKQAQYLHAAIYIERGYITEDELGPDRRMHLRADPYQAHAQYFVVTNESQNGAVVATARQINAVEARGHASFPTVEKLKLYQSIRDAIEKVDPAHCVEISALAKAHGASSSAVLMLYRTMWQYSLTQGHRLWLMSVDSAAYARLKFLFGDALVRIGDNTIYMGSEVVPAMLEVERSLAPLKREGRSWHPVKRMMRREMVKFLLVGLGDEYRNRLKHPVSAFEVIKRESKSK